MWWCHECDPSALTAERDQDGQTQAQLADSLARRDNLDQCSDGPTSARHTVIQLCNVREMCNIKLDITDTVGQISSRLGWPQLKWIAVLGIALTSTIGVHVLLPGVEGLSNEQTREVMARIASCHVGKEARWT